MRNNAVSDETAVPPLVGDSYEIVPGRRATDGKPSGPLLPGLVLLCDHAGNAFPPGYGTLGLPAAEIERHIAYDIGAAGVVRAMASRLGAPAVLSRYSRLLIDLNRGADDPTLIMRLSDGAIVPGNQHIDEHEWNERIRLYYAPYHAAIERVLQSIRQQGETPVIISLHSFTDNWKGVPRPWHAGILWDRDHRLPNRLIETLRADPTLVVGDNQPYSGQLEGDCLNQHATRNGLSHALIEVRQDLIGTEAGQRAWAERLSVALQGIWAEPDAATVLCRLNGEAAPLRAAGSQPHMTLERLAAAPA